MKELYFLEDWVNCFFTSSIRFLTVSFNWKKSETEFILFIYSSSVGRVITFKHYSIANKINLSADASNSIFIKKNCFQVY